MSDDLWDQIGNVAVDESFKTIYVWLKDGRVVSQPIRQHSPDLTPWPDRSRAMSDALSEIHYLERRIRELEAENAALWVLLGGE